MHSQIIFFSEDINILNILQQIKASITNLEAI